MLERIKNLTIMALLVLHICLMPLSIFYKINIGINLSLSFLSLLFAILLSSLILLFINTLSLLTILLISSLCLIPAMFNGIDTNFLVPFFICIMSSTLSATLSEKQFVRPILILSFFLAIIGIIFYFSDIAIFDAEYTGSSDYFSTQDGHYRAMSIFLNPNSFAYFLVYAICLLFFEKTTNLNRASLALPLLIALYLTYSRSAALSLLIATLFFFASQIKNRNTRIFFGLLLELLTYLAVFITIFNMFYMNTNDRTDKWLAGIDILMSRMNWLVGINSSTAVVKAGVSFSDNMFIMAALKLGVFSLVAIVLYLYIRAKSLIIIFNNSENENKLKLVSSVYILSTIFPMVFSNYLMFYPVLVFFGISCGLLLKKA